jgi:uncharacterized membrane-anchored protein YjiN (DUF445 family)
MNKVDKKVVVGHLDAKCDRRLFLSIMNHGGKANLSDDERSRLEIPDKYKLRTRGLGISQRQGKKLEEVYYRIIANNFPGEFHHFHKSSQENQQLSENAFIKQCRDGLPLNSFSLEVSFDTQQFMSGFYQNLGKPAGEASRLPHLGFMRPDIILAARAATLNKDGEPLFAVKPDGDITQLDTEDPRTCLFICDIKLAEEATISQFAEVALYGWMLSNWLEHHGLSTEYVVVDTIGVWTNATYSQYDGDSNVELKGNNSTGKLADWLKLLSIRTFDQYVSSIKQVLIDSIPKVLDQKENWQSLEYHVSPNCELCDFLGRMDQKKASYVNQETNEVIYRNFDNFCAHKAYRDKHLSIVPGITKGARRALTLQGINSAKALIDCEPAVFQIHSALKKQAHRIPDKTQAILRRGKPDFFKSNNISLARFPNLAIKFHINYDISNGLAASFAVQGAYSGKVNFGTPKEERPKVKIFETAVFVVKSMSYEEEATQLKGFLSAIEEMFDFATAPENNHVDAFDMNRIDGRPTVQFYCWDHYQLDFIKKILARHLDVLLVEDFSRALLWLFSPDDLLDDPAFFQNKGKGGRLIAPYICVLKDIIQENGKWPIETTYPLFIIASMIDDKFKESYEKTSWLHKSQLGDYIPRERILEIWLKVLSDSDVHRKALADYAQLNTASVPSEVMSAITSLDVSEIKRNDLESLGSALMASLTDDDKKLVRKGVYENYVNRYSKSARNQTWAIAACRKFIAINKNLEKRAYPAPIMMETMLERQKVFTQTSIKTLPADSQIWTIFAILDDQFASFEYNAEIASSIESLESKYSCIVIKRELTEQDRERENLKLPANRNSQYYYVSEDSKNCKIRDQDGFLTLLLQDSPGFPFQRPSDVIRATEDSSLINFYERNFQAYKLNRRFMDLLSVTVNSFDRIKGIVELTIRKSDPIIDQLLEHGLLNFGHNIAVARSAPLKRNHVMLRCLKQIGHPSIAHPDPASRKALLKKKAEKANDNHPITRAAEVLWTPDILNQVTRVIKGSVMRECLNFVSQSTGRYLPNSSQKAAIEASLTRDLNLIWGPPGTGKTDTSLYILGSELKMAQDAGHGKRILVTGPTKRAVSEVLHRLRGVLADLEQSRLKLICLSGTTSHDYDFIFDDDWLSVSNKAIGYGVKFVEGRGVLEGEYQKLTNIRDMLVAASNSTDLVVVATHHHSIYPLLTGASIKSTNVETPCCAELFDFILVDESSQIDVADSLSILNSMDKKGRIIFAGDHLQMSPIQQAKAPKETEHMIGSIQNYLQRRFDIIPTQLLTNYRSNDIIVNYGKRLGYPGDLQAQNTEQRLECDSESRRPLPGLYDKLMSDENIDRLFIPGNAVVSVRYSDGMSGQANPFEAMLTVNLILKYYKHALEVPDFDTIFWQSMVGVVTPHKAQRALIVKELCQIFPSHLHPHIDRAVDTVERFQGGERNMIIISYGVGDEDIISQEEGFLLNLNRTNVAISRAKQQAVLIMSEEILQHLTADEEVAEQAKALKRYDHYCHNEMKFTIPWQSEQIQLTYRSR